MSDPLDLDHGPMDAAEAAAFLCVSEGAFRRIAPSLPRHKRPGVGFRYLRSELLAWVRGDGFPGDAKRDSAATATPPHVGSQRLTKHAPRKGGGTVTRLV